MAGEVTILNVGEGDTKLSFDPESPADVRHAAAVVGDMLKRGFALLVKVGEREGEPLYQRARGFDPETGEYIVIGTPEETDGEAEEPKKTRRAAKPRKQRIKARDTSAVAVARSAGG